MGKAQRWLADENFNSDIVRALFRRSPDIDLVRVQACGLSGASDPEILMWATTKSRLILTNDVRKFSAHTACDGRTASMGSRELE
jgi:predicted nuclease of predicted toxin-antitoxin system